MWASASAALLTAWRQCLPFFCLPFYCLSIVFLFLIFYLFSFGCAGSLSLNRLFSSRGEQGRPLVAVCRLLLLEASFVVELRLKGVWASVVQECDPWAWWFRSVTHGLGGSGAWPMGLVVQEHDPWAWWFRGVTHGLGGSGVWPMGSEFISVLHSMWELL